MIPILYSFRRCPYAIRARLAVSVSGVEVELREILLRDKAPEFLATSPSATVPCLKTDTQVIDESFDVMLWALQQNDPDGWLEMPKDGFGLIEESDGPFKTALDRTKYHTRYADADPEVCRADAMQFLDNLNEQLEGQSYLFGARPTLADMAILPFIRQFAFIDKNRFDAEAGAATRQWLENFLESSLFHRVMPKLPVWKMADAPTVFRSEIILPQQ